MLVSSKFCLMTNYFVKLFYMSSKLFNKLCALSRYKTHKFIGKILQNQIKNNGYLAFILSFHLKNTLNWPSSSVGHS